MQPDHDLHVLADRAGPFTDVFLNQPVTHQRREIPAGPDHGLLLEDGEDTGENQNRVQPVQSGPAGGEGTQVLHHLESGPGMGWQAHVHHFAVPDGAAIRDVDLAGVFLVDHHQLGNSLGQRHHGLIGGADSGGSDGIPVWQVGTAEPEGAFQHLHRVVLGTIVDYDYLEPGIVAEQEVGDAVNDRHFLVEGGDHHRDRLGVVALVDQVEVFDEMPGHA